MFRRKAIARILAIVLCMCLAGCSAGAGKDETASSSAQTVSNEDPGSQTGGFAADGLYNVNEEADVLEMVNLREEMSTDSNSLALLMQGEKVTRTGYGSTWSRVSFGGITGYVLSSKLSASDSVIPAETTRSAENTGMGNDSSETSPENAGEANPGEETQPDVSETETPQTESVTETTAEETPVQTDPAEQLDAAAYSADPIDWGYDSNSVDGANRPNGAVAAQEAYGSLGASFLGNPDQTILLTFNEGYEAGNTASILDTLAATGVKAVFFCTMQYFQTQPELVQRMINEGHIVANQSTSSSGFTGMTLEEAQADILAVHQFVQDTYGYNMTLFRFPSGNFSQQLLAMVHNLNYRSVFWSFAYADWNSDNQMDIDSAFATMVNQLHPGAIYMLSGISTTNAQVLPAFIQEAMNRGYTFRTEP